LYNFPFLSLKKKMMMTVMMTA